MGGIARGVADRVRSYVYLDEQHLWYTLDLDSVEQRPLAEGYELRLGTDADMDLITGMPGTSREDADENRARGAEAWLVMQGEEAAFVCWIFPRALPFARRPIAGSPCPPVSPVSRTRSRAHPIEAVESRARHGRRSPRGSRSATSAS